MIWKKMHTKIYHAFDPPLHGMGDVTSLCGRLTLTMGFALAVGVNPKQKCRLCLGIVKRAGTTGGGAEVLS